MIVFVSMKQTIDKHQQGCDLLEQNYIDYLVNHPQTPKQSCFIPIVNHVDHFIQLKEIVRPDWVLFTGGNNLDPNDWGDAVVLDDLAKRRDQLESRLFAYAIKEKIPILAICRGFQHINLLMGGQVCWHLPHHPPKPHHVVYQGKPYEVNSYHGHGVHETELAQDLQPIVIDAQSDIIEAYQSRTNTPPILGIQWHPERPKTDPQLFTMLYSDFLKKAKISE